MERTNDTDCTCDYCRNHICNVINGSRCGDTNCVNNEQISFTERVIINATRQHGKSSIPYDLYEEFYKAMTGKSPKEVKIKDWSEILK